MEADPLSRFAICSLLSDSFEVESLDCRREAIDMVRNVGGYRVMLLDVCRDPHCPDREPTGTETIRAIRKRETAVGIVARGSHPWRHLAHEALSAGADGYLSREAGPEQLRAAVDRAADHEPYLDPAVRSDGAPTVLTRRQCEILQLMSEGRSTAYASGALSLSEETVKTHMKHILARLQARNRPHAIAIAIREGMIE